MYCPKCGNALPEGSSVCPVCSAQQNAPVQPIAQVSTLSSAPNLVWGIVSIACACFFSPILGIIFSIIAKNKITEYLNAGGVNDGKTQTGMILSRIALSISIVYLVIIGVVLTIYLLMIAGILAGGLASSFGSSSIHF